MTALLQQTIAAFALHALWQVPLLAGAAWFAIRVGRPHVRFAHFLWAATLVLCVAAPAVSTVAGRYAAIRAQRDARVTVTFDSTDYNGPLPAFQHESAWKRMLRRHVNGEGVHPFALELSDRAAAYLAAVYLLVAGAFALRLFVAWRRSASLVRNANHEHLPREISHALKEQCEAMGIAQPALALSREIHGPALAGVLEPTLLLPHATAEQMTPAELDAVLAHELAHLQRHDPVLHAASSLLLVPVAFHPAALWVAHRLRQTREMACDAAAAQHMGSPTQYAHALLQVAERTGSGPERVAGLGLFTTGLGFLGTNLELFGAASAMEERMESLMNTKSGKGSRAARMTAALSLAAIPVLAAGMMQVQPVLACDQVSQDATPRLIGGDHAREQLQNARKQLDQAAAHATTDDERRKIATARELTAVAEQQIAAASGEDRHTTVHLDRMAPLNINLQALDHLSVDPAVRQEQLQKFNFDMSKLHVQLNSPEFKAQMEDAQRQAEEARKQFDTPAFKAQMEEVRRKAEEASKQFDTPEFKAQIEKARRDAEAASARMNTPEFRAEIQRQVDAAKISRLAIDRSMALAHEAQMAASGQFRITVKPNLSDGTMIARVEAPEGVVPPVAEQKPASPQKVPSNVMAGQIINHTAPVYPPEAKEKKISGAVVLHALISEDGKVSALQVVSSPDASLSKSAVTAVQQWTYKPYLLNGDPTAVDTTITVNYSLVE